MRAAGLLDLSLPADFLTPDPSRAGDEDLDPIDDGDETPEFAQDFVTEDEG
jgi:segregation and condensation protein B